MLHTKPLWARISVTAAFISGVLCLTIYLGVHTQYFPLQHLFIPFFLLLLPFVLTQFALAVGAYSSTMTEMQAIAYLTISALFTVFLYFWLGCVWSALYVWLGRKGKKILIAATFAIIVVLMIIPVLFAFIPMGPGVAAPD